MTPKEIYTMRSKITQTSVEAFAQYMDNWMKSQGQPSKNLVSMVIDMKKDKDEPYLQMRYLLGSTLDWFAYGN